MDLETIKQRIAQMEKLEQSNRACREMLKSELENDPSYMEAVEEAKAATAKKKRIKDEILGKGPNQKLMIEMKENSEELATLREILSAELMQTYEESHTDEVQDHEGSTRKFVVLAKLLPRGKQPNQRRDLAGRYVDGEDAVVGMQV